MEDEKIVKRFIIWGIVVVLLVAAFVTTCNLTFNTAKKATHIDDGITVYEEFQEIYNTCDKLNTDLCNMRDLPADDKMFEQFSKPQRILTLQTNLNRWVQEYNAKSNMWGRALWKSSKLPFELSVNNFICYSSPKN